MDLDTFFKVVAEDMICLAKNNSFEDQYPINIITIDKNITNITTTRIMDFILDSDIKSSCFWGNVLLFLLNRNFVYAKKRLLFRKTIDKLSTIRQDLSLRSSLELSIKKDYPPQSYSSKDIISYKKLIFALDFFSEYVAPIYRGWSYDIYTQNGTLIREYRFPDKKYFLVGQVITPPKLDVFGHVLTPEKIKSYSIFEQLQEKEYVSLQTIDVLRYIQENYVPLTFNSNSDKLNFVLKQWANLFHLPHKPISFDEKSFLCTSSQKTIDPELEKKIMAANIKYYSDLYG